MPRKKLVVCAIFENVASRLPEWLAYHSVVGVEHFVLYDNDSEDDPARVVRALPLAEHVTLIRWRQRPGQLAAYRHFIDIFAPGFEWAAFLGVEDFLLPLSGGSILGALDCLDTAAAVMVARRVFSPVPSSDPSSGLVIEMHDRRAGDEFAANCHVRVIAHCRDLLDVGTAPHEFRIAGSAFDTAGRLAPNSAVQVLPCYRNLVVNHYGIGSLDDWLARIQQDIAAASGGRADAGATADILAELSRVPDNSILAFAPAMRALLGLEPADAATAAPARAEVPVPSLAGEFRQPESGGTASVAAAEPPVIVGLSVAAAGTQPELAMAEPELAVAATPGPAQQAFAPAPAVVATPIVPRWRPCGSDALERIGGTGLVFRDRSRPGEQWLAALRGAAAAGIDPAFLMDEFDRIREFPNADEARAACEAALTGEAGT